MQRSNGLAESIGAAHRRDDETVDAHVDESLDLFLFAVEPVRARRKEKSVAELVGALLSGVGDEGEEGTGQIAEHKPKRGRRANPIVLGWPGGDESPAPDSAVEDPFANQTGEGFVDGYDGDAIGDGELAMGLELGPNRHLAVEDLSADVEGDLLVERGGRAGV